MAWPHTNFRHLSVDLPHRPPPIGAIGFHQRRLPGGDSRCGRLDLGLDDRSTLQPPWSYQFTRDHRSRTVFVDTPNYAAMADPIAWGIRSESGRISSATLITNQYLSPGGSSAPSASTPLESSPVLARRQKLPLNSSHIGAQKLFPAFFLIHTRTPLFLRY